MRLLDVPQARHFCSPAPTVVTMVGRQSLRTFHSSIPKNVSLIREGQTHFQVHQINVLASVDQWLLFATTHYRRALDLLVPAAAPWAQVTLYYSSFFAANAILGMFGGWVGQTTDGLRVVDVEHGVPTVQELRIYRKLRSPNGAVGSHRAFWDFFYDAVASIAAWAPASLKEALDPVNGDYAWQIAERNNVNYDMFSAWDAARLFHQTFKSSRLTSLSGPLRLQFDASEKLIRLALKFASDVGLSTGALYGCGQEGNVTQIRKRLGAQQPPRLVAQSAFSEF